MYLCHLYLATCALLSAESIPPVGIEPPFVVFLYEACMCMIVLFLFFLYIYMYVTLHFSSEHDMRTLFCDHGLHFGKQG